MKSKKPLVSIVMGSQSDLATMKEASKALKKFGVSHELNVISAHRTPKEVSLFAEKARTRGIKVVIAGAGGAAHLPGMIAAYTELPVIGVPVSIGSLKGEDALLSIVQMPKGVPVATVAIGNAWNAGVLAAQMLGCDDKNGAAILGKIATYKKQMRREVLSKRRKLFR